MQSSIVVRTTTCSPRSEGDVARTTANGIDIHYELAGPEGAPVVTLSHSIATDSRMWASQVETLASRFRVLCFDTRGHGRTDAPPGAYSLGRLAEDANALLAALGIERTHFVGLSMGGMIGQVLALTHPERLRSLALCDTSARMPPEMGPIWDERIATALTSGMEALVEPTIGRWFTPGFIEARSEVVDSVREMIRATDVQGYVGQFDVTIHHKARYIDSLSRFSQGVQRATCLFINPYQGAEVRQIPTAGLESRTYIIDNRNQYSQILSTG